MTTTIAPNFPPAAAHRAEALRRLDAARTALIAALDAWTAINAEDAPGPAGRADREALDATARALTSTCVARSAWSWDRYSAR